MNRNVINLTHPSDIRFVIPSMGDLTNVKSRAESSECPSAPSKHILDVRSTTTQY